VKGRWLLVGLVASLALNLFLVGLGAGALLFAPKDRPGDGQAAAGQRRAPLWMAGRGLSEEKRPVYREVLVKATLAARPDLMEARRLRRRAFDMMAAETYDPKAVASELERARGLEFRARSRVERDIAAFAATLSPEERSALSESLRGAMTRMIGNRGRQDWRPRGQDGPPPPPEE